MANTALPKPSSTFTIPSLHDDLELDCRIYYPRRTEKKTGFFGKAFAILAHPYAPLGGSYDDPVVALVGNTLLRNGITLGTFNFRGAHGSAGKTSWSGKAELGDCASVYGFMICYMNYIQAQTFKGVEEVQGIIERKPLLILGGYSYGSLITSHLPACQWVSQMFQELGDGSAEKEIKSRAEHLARDLVAYLDMKVQETSSRGRASLQVADGVNSPARGVAAGGYDSEAASRRISRESSRRSFDADRVRQSIDRARHKLKPRNAGGQDSADTAVSEIRDLCLAVPEIAFLLVSPLLPPVAGFTTMFSKLILERKRSAGKPPLKGDESDQLLIHQSCCIYGSKDVFTSHKKLRKWTEEQKVRSCSSFSSYEIEGAGHFWHEAAAPGQLQSSLVDWLSKLQPNSTAAPEGA